mmetsp:Transcript_13983/g.21328  ORF Transcript_13983/g.21328 Transcript_13983/m.21328 type:complete len:287 (+) Transcript_13983:355-1215(+)
MSQRFVESLDGIPNQWIVYFNPPTTPILTRRLNALNSDGEPIYTEDEAIELAVSYDGTLTDYFDEITNGFLVIMSEGNARKLSQDERVELVSQDQFIYPTEVVDPTWGQDRIDKRDLPLNNKYQPKGNGGSSVTVYVMDSGIRTSHKEFGGRASWGVNKVKDGKNYDCLRHGTHVAGTIGGDNYGVANTVKLIAVKIWSCNNSGNVGTDISAQNWIMKHAQQNNLSGKAILNYSGQVNGTDSKCEKLLEKLTRKRDTLAVVAAGNKGKESGEAALPARTHHQGSKV